MPKSTEYRSNSDPKNECSYFRNTTSKQHSKQKLHKTPECIRKKTNHWLHQSQNLNFDYSHIKNHFGQSSLFGQLTTTRLTVNREHTLNPTTTNQTQTRKTHKNLNKQVLVYLYKPLIWLSMWLVMGITTLRVIY